MRFSLYIAIALMFLGCSKNQNDDCLTSLGDNRTETRMLVDRFDKIYVADRVKVVLVQDSTRWGEISLSGPEGLLSQITSKVIGDEIRLLNENTCNFVRSFDYEIVVKLYVNQVNRIQVESIAEVTTEDTLFIDNLQIFNSALSESELMLSGGEVYVESKNSARTVLTGEIRTLKGSIEEISDLDARDLKCEEALLDSHTPLDCYVDASRGLYVKIYNSGNIYYLEEPSEYKAVAEHEGSGQLLKK